MSGAYITLEGGEGSGKSTMMGFVERFFKERGKDVVRVREPGSTLIAEEIRRILLNPAYYAGLNDRTELLLYEAVRVELIEKVIKPAVLEGKVVLSDRGYDSSTAYQGEARGLGGDIVELLNNFSTNGLRADLTIYFDVSPEIGIERTRKKSGGILDRLEKEGIAFHRRVRESYINIVKKEPGRVKVVDANLSIEEVKKQTLRVLQKFYANFFVDE